MHKTIGFCINIRVFLYVICIKMQKCLLDEGFLRKWVVREMGFLILKDT